jgi:tyrosyl-tRNA synthetase
MEREEIEALELEQKADPGKRPLQKALAKDITCRVHSLADYEMAVAASDILFGKSGQEELKSVDEQTLFEIFEGVPHGEISRTRLEGGLPISEALVMSGFLASNGEAKRALQEASISVNKSKVNAERMLVADDLLNGNVVLLQKGKKNYFLLKVH